MSIARIRPSTDPVFAVLRAMCDSCQDVIPGAAKILPAAYARVRGDDDYVIALATWWATQLTAAAGHIALDDLHLLEENADAWMLIEQLIDATQGRLSWVLASRTGLHLPTIRWVADGRMGPPIHNGDLTLDESDIEEFGRSLGVTMSAEQRRTVREKTMGWPLMVAYLVRVWNDRQDDSDAIEQARVRSIDAIASASWSRCSPADRSLIVTLALLDGASLAVLHDHGFENAEELLTSVLTKGVVISRDAAGVYSVHDLWQDFLWERQRAVLEVEGRKLIERLISDSELSSALAVATRLEFSDAIIRLATLGPDIFFEPDDVPLADRALALLSRRVGREDPLVIGMRAFQAYRRGDPYLTISQLEKAIATAAGDLRATLARRLSALYGNMRRYDDFSRALNIAEGNVSPTNIAERTEILCLRAAYFAGHSQHAKAKEAAHAALQAAASVDNPGLASHTHQRAGFVAFLGNDLWVAREFAESAIRFAELAQEPWISGRAHQLLSAIAHASWDYRGTKVHAERAMVFAVKTFNRVDTYRMLLQLLSVAATEGELEEYQRLKDRIRELGAPQAWDASFLTLFYEAITVALCGQLRKAIVLLKTSTATVRPTDPIIRNAVLALLHGLDNEEVEALRCCREVLKLASASAEGWAPVDIRSFTLAQLLITAVFLRFERRHDALPLLTALRRSEHGVVRCLVDHVETLAQGGSPSSEPIDIIKGYQTLLARLFEEAPSRLPLTRAENRVLALLAEGLSSKQMASNLGRSVKTIDNQIASIMRKLGARNRGHAVAIARASDPLAR